MSAGSDEAPSATRSRGWTRSSGRLYDRSVPLHWKGGGGVFEARLDGHVFSAHETVRGAWAVFFAEHRAGGSTYIGNGLAATIEEAMARCQRWRETQARLRQPDDDR